MDPIAAEPLVAAATPFAPLQTERFALRPWRPDDAAALHRLINDWDITRSLSGVPYPYSRAQADEWIGSAAQQLAGGKAFHLAVVVRETSTLIGGVGLRVQADRRAGLLGYWVGRKQWGTGVATEAAGRILRWGLANLDLDALEAVVAHDNPASAAVLAKLGFRANGEGSAPFLARGGEHRVLRYIVRREDLASEPPPVGLAAALKPRPTAPGPKPAPAAGEPIPGARLLLVAACALIDADGRVLVARRPEGKSMAGLWEFPGGKLLPGETPEAAVIRELREELGIDVSATCLAAFAFASHAYPAFHLLMPLYLCRRWAGTPRGVEGQALAWVRPNRLADYPMPEADKPLIPLLRDFL